MDKKKFTIDEKKVLQIAQLKAQLQRAESQLAQKRKKDRDGQLVAWGVYVEEFYKHADESGKQKLEDSIKKHLTGRNLDRALAGLARLDGKASDTEVINKSTPENKIASILEKSAEQFEQAEAEIEDATN